MLVARSFQNVNSFILLGCVILCLVFMIQLKQIYNNNQKYNRYLGYKRFVNEISTEMKIVERSVNRSSLYVHQLNELLFKHRERDWKNATVLRTSFPT